MRTGIYAIYDKMAQAIVGGLYLFKADAPATRFFTDVIALPDSQIGKHVDDYELVQLGFLASDDEVDGCEQLEPAYRIVLTGSAWRILNGPKLGEAHASA